MENPQDAVHEVKGGKSGFLAGAGGWSSYPGWIFVGASTAALIPLTGRRVLKIPWGGATPATPLPPLTIPCLAYNHAQYWKDVEEDE